MNLKSILKNYDFSHDFTEPKNTLYNRFKTLNKYINLSNSMKKEQIVNIIKKLSIYNKENNDYSKFMINNEEITMNEEQQQVIKAPTNNHIRIVACAGSGKTTTIICRIKYLVDNYVTPDKILLLTFNVDAYENLKKKINDLFGFEIKMEIRTIDSFCAKLYHQYTDIRFNNTKNISLSEYVIYADKIMANNAQIICNNYSYVFFDEYQDINDLQFNILNYFVQNNNILTVVGDDNQNIYQWRGSNNKYIIDFDNLFPDSFTFTLSTNYRSTNNIINIANKSISHNRNKIDKTMKGNKKHNIFKPTIQLLEKKKSQFKFIINKILELKQTGYKFHDFCILCRNNLYLKLFEEYLSKYIESMNIHIPHISLITEDESDTKQKLLLNHVTLTTIHRSKGLEWECCFIIGLNDNMFPLKMHKNDMNLEEERRLFYVAVTRSRNYLYFVCNVSELPLSTFILEVLPEVNYVNDTGKNIYDEVKKLFFDLEEDSMKTNYNTGELVRQLKPNDYEYLRTNNLLPNFELVKTNIFPEKLLLNDDIKKNCLDSDFKEFCTRIIYRNISMNNDKNITDIYANEILNIIHLTKKEYTIYLKYNLSKIAENFYYDKKKIVEYVSLQHKENSDLDLLLFIVDLFPDNEKHKILRENTYPKTFIKKLKIAYDDYTNKTNKCENIFDSVYTISLCYKFSLNRRRLIYKNVHPLFIQNFDKINNRLFEYSELIKKNDNRYLNSAMKTQQIKNKLVTVKGKIDMIDFTNGIIIEIKCSENNFKIEWIIEILMNYSLLKLDQAVNINKIIIFNILKGKTYEFLIPENYDCEYMWKYMISSIKNNMGINDHEHNFSISNFIEQNQNTKINDTKKEIKIINIAKTPNNNIMVLDTECTGTNIYNDDIIQLAYVLYDNLGNIIKKFNKYIIPEYKPITKDSFMVHGISQKFVNENGDKLDNVITEFFEDLKNTNYIVGHNINFDINMILNNLRKRNYDVTNLFEQINIHCTLKMARIILGKSFKLKLLYNELFNENMKNAHNALYDVLYCAQCYFKLMELYYEKILCCDHDKDIVVLKNKYIEMYYA